MQPVVDRLKDDYAGRITFVELDANGDGETAFEAGQLPGHPAFVIMQPDGRELWRGFGLVEESDLITALDNALAR